MDRSGEERLRGQQCHGEDPVAEAVRHQFDGGTLVGTLVGECRVLQNVDQKAMECNVGINNLM